MDPVNKWLLTVILFMFAVAAAIVWVGGSGRYQFAVEKSALFEDYAVVYVLDTKDGVVRAKLVDENDLHYKNNPKATPVKVFNMPGYSQRRY